MKKPLVKYVLKAAMWCVTYWDADGKQQQEWFDTEQQATKASKKL